MTRTAAREMAVRLCYGLSENPRDPEEALDEFFESEYYATLSKEDELYESEPDERQTEYIRRLVKGSADHGAELDGYIEKYTVGWKFSRISRTALAVIRIAMYEVLYMQDEVPPRAAITEAVALAKKYEEPETVPFVNGVLGSFVRGEVGEK